LAPGRPWISDEFKSTQPPLLEVLNIEQQNKEPQNDEVVTSIFDIPCSIFCGLKESDGRGDFLISAEKTFD
jgi:hypothetical protein